MFQVTFKCSGGANPPVQTDAHVDPQTGVHLLEATATVSRNMVEEYFGQTAYACECIAYSTGGAEIRSRPAQVTSACKFSQKSHPVAVYIPTPPCLISNQTIKIPIDS